MAIIVVAAAVGVSLTAAGIAVATPAGTVDYGATGTNTSGLTLISQGRDIQGTIATGTVVKFGAKLVATSGSKVTKDLVFACRTPSGANCDFGHVYNHTFDSTTYTYEKSSLTSTFSTVGTYQVWVAFNDGSWRNLTPKMSVTVATVASPPPTTASASPSSPSPSPSSPSPTPSSPSPTPSSPSPTPSDTGTPPPVTGPVGGGAMTLAFSDEFDGTAVDTSKWGYQSNAEASWCSSPLGTGNSGNQQLEFDQPGNVSESGGSLHLTAQRQTITACGHTYNWTSGLVTSTGYNARYGWIEASMKLPAPKGFWPAFWTWGVPGSGNNETDAMEFYSDNHTKIYQTSHTSGGGSCATNVSVAPYSFDPSGGYHVYAAHMTSGGTDYYIDGHLTCHTVGTSQNNDRLILDNFVYSTIPPDAATNTAVTDIDWVHWWQ